MAQQRGGFAVVGLGKMGGNLSRQGLEKGFQVVGMTRGNAPADLVNAGLEPAATVAEICERLPAPRRVFLYVPAGAVVDTVLDDLAEALDAGDIVLDGGNSYWGDSIRRHQRLDERGIAFIDLGTSGGISGARDGACFMAGGDADAFAAVEPILRALAVEGGVAHAGPPGAGHFVKLVHNGIEFGMLQAIGEGLALMEGYRDKLPVADVLDCWCNGSVIRSWLVELLAAGYRERGGVAKVPSFVEDTGEVNWLVNDAMHMEIPVPVIAQSVMQLFASRLKASDAERAIATMRHGFGGHPFGADESIARERRQGRVGPFPDGYGSTGKP